jgi:MFS family permease
MAGGSMTQRGLFTFLPICLANELKYPPALIVTYVTVVQASGIFSSLISGFISDRKGRRSVLTAGLFTTSLVLVALVILRLNFLILDGSRYGCLDDNLAPKNIRGITVSTPFLWPVLDSPAFRLRYADRFGIFFSFYFLAFTTFAANFLVYLIPDKPLKEKMA